MMPRPYAVSRYMVLTAVILAGASGAVADDAPRPLRAGLEAEDLGTPVKSRTVKGESVLTNPLTGEQHLVATMVHEPKDFQIFDLNLATGKGRIANGFRAGTWVPYQHSNGKIYFGSGRPSTLTEYDPATGEAKNCGVVIQSNYAALGWFCEDKQGRLYMGMYGLFLGRYDPKAGEMVSAGPLGRDGAKEYGYVYSLAVDAPWAYIGTAGGGGVWYLIGYNFDTKEIVREFYPNDDEKELRHDVCIADDGGIYYDGQFKTDGKLVRRTYRLENGRATLVDKPPKGLRRCDQHGSDNVCQVYQVREKLGLEFDLSRMTPTNWSDGAMTARWRKVGEKDWHEATVPGADIQPCPVRRLAAAPDGTLIGVSEYYGVFFTFDPKTKTSAQLGASPGSPYDIIVTADRAYVCGYSAFLAAYDRSKPWTWSRAGGDTNPSVSYFGGKWNTSLALGGDGRIYVGGKHGRHDTGSSLTWYDPKTGTHGAAMRDPTRSLYDLIAINKGGLILASTEKRIVVYDTAKQALLDPVECPAAAPKVGNLFDAGRDRAIGLVALTGGKDKDGKPIAPTALLYKLNVRTGEALWQKTINGRIFAGNFRSMNRRFELGPDGCGWLYIDEYLCRIHPSDGAVEKVLKFPEGGRMVFAGDDLYLYNGGETDAGFTGIKRILRVFAGQE